MGARDLIGDIRGRVRKFVREQLPEFFQRIFGRVPRKAALLGIGGAAVAVILAFVAVLLAQNYGRVARSRAAARELADSFKPLAIAPEDFFLPEEPDALPGFIPERPQRAAWTAVDAAEYWTDPLAGKERLWRDRFGAVIDDLVEAVP